MMLLGHSNCRLSSRSASLSVRRRKSVVPVLRACPTSVAASRMILLDERAGCIITHAVHSDVASLPEAQWRDNQLRWSRPSGVAPVNAPSDAPAIVILPGFGNATTDYTEPFGNKKAAIATSLAVRGWQPFVVPVERKDWFRVARGLLTRGFWRGQLTTHPGYTWYLERVGETVARAVQETGSEQVILVGHSAGGWLGRAFLADPRYQSAMAADSAAVDAAAPAGTAAAGQPLPPPGTSGAAPHPRVRMLVTLGTPQRPPPPEKKRDMTGGAQGWVDRSYPGAFFAPAGVSYLTVCGRTVRVHRENPGQLKGPWVAEECAYGSYQEVCGEGEGLAGDCVVPLRSAMLPGARQLVLDGVFHYIFHYMSRIGTFDEESGVVWYGSDDVLDCWLGPMLEELRDAGDRGRAQGVEGTVPGGAQRLPAGSVLVAEATGPQQLIGYRSREGREGLRMGP